MRFFILFLFVFFSGFTTQGQEISIMTYNIRLDVASDGKNAWPERKDFLVDQIQFYAPDIFGIQEGMPHQTQFINSKLINYDFIGHGRDGGEKGEYSALFYNTEKFTVANEKTFWLSTTPEKLSKGWDAAYPRICTYGLFTAIGTGHKFWIFNTHLDHIGVAARSKSLILIQSEINKVNLEKYPVFLMGDFNLEPNSEQITMLKRNMADTKDVAKQKFGPDGTFNGFKFSEPVLRRIDYIFLSKTKDVEVLKYAVLSDSKDLKYPSDHLPVYVVLRPVQ
ncbi:endonuclease/exonuclease/phosphatase family protein [Maribacter sp. 2210JD10-5]|uniref:endonuclease/exonuclease/phosphatase family protein n=1 Tax=Maribacter sp. 2210JD10-5 TaxID=3386272 RepID=UPI0039BD6333